MGRPRFWQRSIKNRVTLWTLSIFAVSILAFWLNGRSVIYRVMLDLLGQQQLATASMIATGVAQELDDRRRAIDTLAASLTPALMTQPAALRTRLAQSPTWARQFNAGTYLIRADGNAIPLLPAAKPAGAALIHGWDFVRSALRDGETTVGLASGAAQTTIGLASPLRDARGAVIGALLGLCDARQARFLKQFAPAGLDAGGGYYLLAKQPRRLINASGGGDETLPEPGAVPLLERFIKGDEGSGVLADFQGVEVLASAKNIPSTDWQILLTLPIEDAAARFRSERKSLLVVSLVMGLLAGVAIWLILRRELTPMLSTVKTLASLSSSPQPPQLLPLPGQHEIAELIEGFNGLLSTLVLREAALNSAQAELRIAATAFESHQGMLVTDANGVILRVNNAFTESTGYSAAEAVGQTPRLLKSGRHDDDFYREMWACVGREGKWQGEVWDRRKNGEIYPKWLSISRVCDPNGVVTHYVGAHFDITERKQKEGLIHQLAFYDPLTELPNRRLLGDRLEQAIAAGKRTTGHGALMFLDLDNFKSLNDRHGHIAGDTLLVEAASRLKQCVREVDTVARFGGDEFVVLLGELSTDSAESASRARIVAEKIRAALAAPYRLSLRLEGQAETIVEHHCSASIGVVLLPNDGASSDELLKWGDAAMYRAKAAGRNTIHVHDSCQTPAAARDDVVAAIDTATPPRSPGGGA